jgi:DNA-binding NtrC family response regulator
LVQGKRERAGPPSNSLTTAPTEDRDENRASGESGAHRPGLVTLFPLDERKPPALWRISGPASVGRSRAASIRPDDPHISRYHAVAEARPNGILLRDAGSKHGTFVRGTRVASDAVLAPFGSIVRLGDTLLLAVPDTEPYHAAPRRIPGARIGLLQDMVASPTLAQAWDQAERAAKLKDPVLILGESGSGKECVARIVHAFSGLAGAFVGINVAAVPEALFEAELFGHERGAFTGAASARPGAFREAKNGVLFLDEIGDLRPEVQAKLLRTLDLQRVRPLGANRDVPVDARIVSATSRDLREDCDAGNFRGDLWYRLSGIVIRVPPLRERPLDIVLLALSMLREQAEDLRLSSDALELLLLAGWEGNARQLRHAISHGVDRASQAGGKVISREHLPDLSVARGDESELSEERIRASMLKAGGVVARAAELLGVSRTTFYNSIKRLNLDAPSLRR